jgi:hypothetical protein
MTQLNPIMMQAAAPLRNRTHLRVVALAQAALTSQ